MLDLCLVQCICCLCVLVAVAVYLFVAVAVSECVMESDLVIVTVHFVAACCLCFVYPLSVCVV